MTGTQVAALVRKRTRTNSTTFTDADMLVDVNIFKDEISSMIVERNSGYFLIPSTFDLVANQREYSFDDGLLSRIHKVELKFAAADSRFPATFIKDYGGSETESEIVKLFSNAYNSFETESGGVSKGAAGFAYTIRRRGIYVLSGTIIAVTAGGHMWWHKYPADLANLTGTTGLEVDPSTTTFGFPRQFHELLARRVGVEYKGRQPKPIPLNAMELRFEKDLETQLAAISHIDNSGELIAELPEPLAYGNDGWNY